VSTDSQVSASGWGRLIDAVVRPASDLDANAHLALAMSLGSAITPDGVACSVTQVTDSGYRTPVWSNQVALDLDRAQYDAGEGPCVATAQDGRVHTIEVMAEEPLYRAFTKAARHRGVQCSLSLPLAGDTPSALNLYARATSAYGSHRTRATAELLAHCVGTLLAHQPASADDGLDAALDRRGLIERAQAELVRRGAPDEDEAYLRMTQLSRTQHRSIFAVAQDLAGNGPAASAALTS
jgi:hypothetical protein